jgi:hypothetical protein
MKKRLTKIKPKSSNPGAVNNWQTTGGVMRKVIFLLAFASNGVLAETPRLVPNAQVNYYGIGANTCAQYLGDRKQDGNSSGVRGAFYATWFKGYVSGFNQFATKQVKVQLEPSRVVAYFDKWCSDNPSGNVVGAALCLTAASGGAPIDFSCKQ